MEPIAIPQFSAAGLTILDRQRYDPKAKGAYEFLSGGLIWPDELPSLGTAEWMKIAPGFAFRYLVDYRASVTLGEERLEFRRVWEQVIEKAPNWPGHRKERWGERARRRLLAAKGREEPCLEELERQLKLRNAVPPNDTRH